MGIIFIFFNLGSILKDSTAAINVLEAEESFDLAAKTSHGTAALISPNTALKQSPRSETVAEESARFGSVYRTVVASNGPTWSSSMALSINRSGFILTGDSSSSKHFNFYHLQQIRASNNKNNTNINNNVAETKRGRSERNSVDHTLTKCPTEWRNPKDRFLQPKGHLRLGCSDAPELRPDVVDLMWGFNPQFGVNWRKRAKDFVFTDTWNSVSSHHHPLEESFPYIDIRWQLVIDARGSRRAVSNKNDDNNTDLTWSGEYICLYRCNTKIGQTSDGDGSREDGWNWKRRIIWLKIYDKDEEETSRNLKRLFISVTILAFFAVSAGIVLNAEDVKYSLWRCWNSRVDDRFFYEA